MIILSISTVKYVEPDEYAVRKRKRGERDGGNNFYQKKKKLQIFSDHKYFKNYWTVKTETLH